MRACDGSLLKASYATLLMPETALCLKRSPPSLTGLRGWVRWLVLVGGTTELQ